MDQREYWDRVSETKEFTTPFQTEEFSRYVEKNACIADIGCGYGRTLDQLRHLGYTNLIGFDISEGMVRRGRRLFPELDLRVMSAGIVDLPSESVDACILFAVLTCIPDDSGEEQLLSEIFRILRPGGILYVNDFLLNTDERNLRRYGQFAEQYGAYGVFELPEGAVLRHFSEERILYLLRGFTEERFVPLSFITMNGNRSNGFYYIGIK